MNRADIKREIAAILAKINELKREVSELQASIVHSGLPKVTPDGPHPAK